MNFSKRTNTVILWIITIGLLVSMVIAFTPSLGSLFGGGNTPAASQPAVLVNGEPISELEVARAKSQNRLFSAVSEGQAASDLQLLLVDTLVQQEVLSQAAARTRVGRGEVRQAVKAWRERNGVADNDRQYLSVLRNVGLDDADFRQLIKSSLQQQKYLEELVKDVQVKDAEVKAFFESNRQSYTSEPRIVAREIVLDDKSKVAGVYARLLSGEDFAAVAKEVSAEKAAQGGALGAAEGKSEPQPVGKAALPTAVANAAFALQAPGLTMPVQAAGRTYIVQVEKYLPAEPQPFEKVEEQVRQDALEAKKQGIQQQKVQELREAATITIPEGSSVSYHNPVVARVGSEEIKASDLDEATYLNPQIQQFLTPDTASLVTSFFKPTILEQLIDTELAYQGAQDLGIDLVGPRSLVAQSARNYVSRDASVSAEELQNYYDANPEAFTIPARAVAERVDFDSQEAAVSFRKALLAKDYSPEALGPTAKAAGGKLESLGVLGPNNDLPAELDTALFGTDAFEPLPNSSWGVSDVLVVSQEVAAAGSGGEASGGATREQAQSGGAEDGAAGTGGAESGAGAAPQTKDVYVVLVAARRPQSVRPLDTVKEQVKDAVLASKRQDLSKAWLDGLRKQITVENLLKETTAAPGGTNDNGGAATGGTAAGAATGGAETGGVPAEPAAGETGGSVR